MTRILDLIKKALQRLFCCPYKARARPISEGLLYEIDRGDGKQPARIFAKSAEDALTQFYIHYEKETM